ncbi:9634_t:CDS:2 [Paraglomus occultum]|uniref:9634_t:CDS:1 n=1 Tax=Paraglomus occultum TaxID=144539 RepID=A0A9N8WJW6_9GLOM|nr:9634_t:CDS:2 [Paraglomus occultum]
MSANQIPSTGTILGSGRKTPEIDKIEEAAETGLKISIRNENRQEVRAFKPCQFGANPSEGGQKCVREEHGLSREGHLTLYIHGGRIGARPIPSTTAADTSQLLILDLSSPFSVAQAPWTLGPDGPILASHSLSVGGGDNNMLIAFGGETPSTTQSTSLFTFDTQSNSWLPNQAPQVTSRMEHSAASKNDSTVYIFGGIPITPSSTNTSAQTQLDQLYMLNTTNMNWSLIGGSQTFSPTGRFHHSATMMDDGRMWIIGGFGNGQMIPMDTLYVFDTVRGLWSNTTAIGSIPTPRRAHQAVGTSSNIIIIFGGCDQTYSTLYNDVYILDVNAEPPIWTQQSTQGVLPAGRYAHSMTLAGDNIVIAFGYTTNFETDPSLLILDAKSFTWMSSYTPKNIDTTSTATPVPSGGVSDGSGGSGGSDGTSNGLSTKTAVIVGTSVGGSLILITAIAVLICCWRRKRRTKFASTSYDEQPSSTPPLVATQTQLGALVLPEKQPPSASSPYTARPPNAMTKSFSGGYNYVSDTNITDPPKIPMRKQSLQYEPQLPKRTQSFASTSSTLPPATPGYLSANMLSPVLKYSPASSQDSGSSTPVTSSTTPILEFRNEQFMNSGASGVGGFGGFGGGLGMEPIPERLGNDEIGHTEVGKWKWVRDESEENE